jgi:hypothetical protein
MSRKKNYKQRCFEAAYDAACENQGLNPIICHGYYWSGGLDYFFLHAWVEIGNEILDYTIQRDPIPKSDYYLNHVIYEQSLKKYTFKEYNIQLCEHMNFWPFHCQMLGNMEPESHLKEVFNR